MDDADVASPLNPLSEWKCVRHQRPHRLHPNHRTCAAGKKCFGMGTNNPTICFTAVRFFRESLEFCVLISQTLN
ncbi:hypothetical protein ACFFV8_08855 [Sphingobium indicum]|uniref:hypothetical protein n=1 Tax=Sphingobium TaxID=165695 RepID=UPI000F685793|nr:MULTISPECIES: hypothetical protein [Sphingobium]